MNFNFSKYITDYLNSIPRPNGNYAIAEPKVCALCGDTNVEYLDNWRLEDIQNIARRVKNFSNGDINLFPSGVSDPKGTSVFIKPRCMCKPCMRNFYHTVNQVCEENGWDIYY